MTDQEEAARLRAKALARWEGEGGALGRTDIALDEQDMRILARLGAALLLEWDEVPEPRRGAMFRHASSLHAERDALRIKAAIAHFMNEHKDR
ncbi:MAG TPA: hypothetical protein VFO00_09255 [Vitreimonas sp.]|nr:hypothetical protein [Vitreimonas sp.]